VAIAVGGLLIAVGGVAAYRIHRRPSANDLAVVNLPPLPHHVTAEVLNVGRVPGAARVATDLVRHAGIDVVFYGGIDSVDKGNGHTRVLIRRGDTTGVGRVLDALGTADVASAPDSTRLVDLSILLGRTFGPPHHP
jgi:hypothetical protein